ncbi:hypothetical protein pb186bvf_012243 [Paramecium bursaria]
MSNEIFILFFFATLEFIYYANPYNYQLRIKLEINQMISSHTIKIRILTILYDIQGKRQRNYLYQRTIL